MDRVAVTPDREVTLAQGAQRAVVSPWGASLRRYMVLEGNREVDIVWGYRGGAGKQGGQGDVLIPFPGRVANGRYSFDGETYQLDRNDKEGPNAIHGFVRSMPWSVAAGDSSSVSFDCAIDAETYGPRGYPFSLTVQVTYRLAEDGLSCSFAITNVGRRLAPVGVGFHPYFTVGTASIDEAEARIPAKDYLVFNQQLAPTGETRSVADTEWDYRAFRPIGARRFNHCFLNLERDAEGMATATLRGGSRRASRRCGHGSRLFGDGGLYG